MPQFPQAEILSSIFPPIFIDLIFQGPLQIQKQWAQEYLEISLSSPTLFYTKLTALISAPRKPVGNTMK